MKQMKQLVTAFVIVFVSFFAYSSTTNDCLRSQILPGLKDSNKGSYIADPVLFNRMYNYNYSYENLPDPDWLLDQIIPLYPFTCEENKTWNKSSSFKVPDQVSEIKPIEGVVIRNVTAFDVFDEENKRWTAKQVGLDYDSVKYGFASGSEQSKEKEFVLINNLMIIEASLTVHLYNVKMDKTKFNLSYSYNRYCNMSKANKTLKGYGKIMSNCGTHYFESVILGGRLWFRVFVSMDAYKADPDNIKQLAVNELERYFGINTTQSGKIEFAGEVGREYFQFGSTEQHYHVNDELANYSYWLKHLPEDPYIVGGQLMPISDLAPNQQDNSQFENAIKLKLAGDFISEKINFIDELQSNARHNFRNVLGYFEMFGNSESLKQQIKKWEIPFHGPYYHNSFINATDDELELVSVSDYKSDPSLYDLVLETYGTHYLSSVKLGGYLVMRTMVNTSYLTSDNNKTIYGNIAANFKQMVNVNGSAEISNSSSHVIFDENTRTNYYYYGGRDGVKNGAMTSEEFKEWVLSVHAVPWMFGGKLTPISFLIQKPNIRAQMELATNVKHNKAILERFENALKLINKENDPVMSTIIKLLSQTVPAFEEIVEVGKTVSKIISDNLSDKPRLGSSEVEELQNGIKHEISGTVRNVVKLF